MSAPQFTPGPWEAVIRGDSEMGDTFFVCYDNDEGYGPSLLEGGLVLADDKRNEANAHLIAAAPELYALVERYRSETPLGNQPHMIAAEADRVLAKARGES